MEAHTLSDIGTGIALYLRLWKASQSPEKDSILSTLIVNAKVQTHLEKSGNTAWLYLH